MPVPHPSPHGCRDSGVEVRFERADDEPGGSMLAAMEEHLAALYGTDNAAVTPSAHPEEMAPPQGAFLVVYEGGAAAGCGGLKRLGPGLCEIKRMYVSPASRGRGHARRILAALEGAARAIGYERVRLDTGALQPHAKSLYESAGYAAIPDYNANPHAAYWFEKAL